MKSSLQTTFAFFALSLATHAAPEGFIQQKFSDSDVTPSPACICANPAGEVFVGVDMLGSLGKGPGKGKIVKLLDTDNDHVADRHTVFAKIDNPRGLISLGTKLWVLHTIIPEDTGVMSAMNLSVLEDADGDGVADGPAKLLVENISTLESNRKRGADHTTNGIRMGIDGWIYIAIGDFGFVDATDRDGTKLTMLGGGVLRVRPDGTGMEVYTEGLRNIYDVAIDPFMNIFTRGNTNDGGGWNVRFIHHIQSAKYGYPTLFINFPEEILPALADVGGGSGTGAIFIDEPTWPDKYNKLPLMCDWGRSQLYIHRVTPDGPTFTQQAQEFVKCPQIADVDVDASGRLYMAAWAGAGYKGNPNKGHVEILLPPDFKPIDVPDFATASVEDLVTLVCSKSAKLRLAGQQELLRRDAKGALDALQQATRNRNLPLESRVAAIFTWAQLGGDAAIPGLIDLAQDSTVREWAVRATADQKAGKPNEAATGVLPYLGDPNPRVQVATAVALGRLGQQKATGPLLEVSNPPATKNAGDSTEYKSAKVTKAGLVEVDVDISDFHELHLIVDNAGNKKFAQAAWVEPVVIDREGKSHPLSQVQRKDARSAKGKVETNKDFSGKPLEDTSGGALKGLGVFARSVIVHKLPPGEYVRFKAKGCLTKGSEGKGTVVFKVARKSSPTGTMTHATPNSDMVLPHVAVRSLVKLGAEEACLDAVGGPNSEGALWALRWMHSREVVERLAVAFENTTDESVQRGILGTLARLYTRESPYDGSWWWGTRPDTRGPYYKPMKWEASPLIESVFYSAHGLAKAGLKSDIETIAEKNRMGLPGIGSQEAVADKPDPKRGEIGRTSIEDVMLAFEERKGNAGRGAEIIKGLSCIGCHNIKPGDPVKAPDLMVLGSQSREAIAESILKPAAVISDTWVNVTTKDGTVYPGTLISKDDSEVVIHDIAGTPTRIPADNVASIGKQEFSVMAPGLTDELSVDEFIDLIEYLKNTK